MIDVCIRPLRSPRLPRRLFIEVLHHVFVNKLLQIDSESVPRGANHYVSANSGRSRNIAAGIRDRSPGWIVAGCHTQLRSGGHSQPLPGGRIRSRKSCAGNQAGQTADESSALQSGSNAPRKPGCRGPAVSPKYPCSLSSRSCPTGSLPNASSRRAPAPATSPLPSSPNRPG